MLTSERSAGHGTGASGTQDKARAPQTAWLRLILALVGALYLLLLPVAHASARARLDDNRSQTDATLFMPLVQAPDGPLVALFSGTIPDEAALSPAQHVQLEAIKSYGGTNGYKLVTTNPAAMRPANMVTFNGLPDNRFAVVAAIDPVVNPGITITVPTAEWQVAADGSVVWSGKDTTAGVWAMLVMSGTDVAGTVYTLSGVYAIHALGNGIQAVRKVEPAQFAMLPTAADATATSPVTAGSSDLPGEDGQLQILFAYTPEALTESGGLAQLDVIEVVSSLNRTFANSSIRLVSVVAGIHQTAETESALVGQTIPDILNDLRNEDDQYLNDVSRLKSHQQADIAVLIVSSQLDRSGQCQVATANASTATAYGVLNLACIKGTFAFERLIGTLLGTQEDKQYSGSDRRWYTLDGPASPRIPYWSNPQIEYNGEPTGTGELDNSYILNTRAADDTARLSSDATQPPVGANLPLNGTSDGPAVLHMNSPITTTSVVFPIDAHQADDGTSLQEPSEGQGAAQPSTETIGGDGKEVAALVVQLLAQQLQIESDQIEVVSIEATEWPDACFDLNPTNMVCAQIITPGYIVIVATNGEQHAYHTNSTGSSIQLADGPVLTIGDV